MNQQLIINKYKNQSLEHKAYLFKSLSSMVEYGCGVNELRSYIKLLSNPELMDDFIFFANSQGGLTHSNCTMQKYHSVLHQYRKKLEFAQ